MMGMTNVPEIETREEMYSWFDGVNDVRLYAL